MENSKLNEKELEQVTGGEDFSIRKDLYENIIIGSSVGTTPALSATERLIPEEERLP